MADADTLQMLDGLKDFISSEPWDLSFLDEQSFTSQNFGHGISKTQQNDDIFGASFGGVPQLSGNQDRKRKRGNSFDLTTSGMHRASQRPRSPAVVVYDAKGHKRGDNFMVDRHVLDVEPEDIQRPQRTMEDMKRARAVLSMLPGVVAILRYACGCKSRQGTCNHYSFSGGLALPDGLICGTCRNGAAIQVGPEIGLPTRPNGLEHDEADSRLLRRLKPLANAHHIKMTSSAENDRGSDDWGIARRSLRWMYPTCQISSKIFRQQTSRKSTVKVICTLPWQECNPPSDPRSNRGQASKEGIIVGSRLF